MTKTKKIICYSLLLSLLTAIFWTVCYLKYGVAPTGTFDFLFFKLEISRWWDILFTLPIVPFCARHSNYDGDDFLVYVLEPLILYLVVYVIAGTMSGSHIGLVIIVLACLFIVSNFTSIVSLMIVIIDFVFSPSLWKKDTRKMNC